jgi:hypothetical protein
MNALGDLRRVMVALSCVCLLAMGGETIVQEAPPKTALAKYCAAVASGDVNAAKQLAASDPGNQLAATMTVRAVARLRVLMKAVTGKFGEDAAKPDQPLNLMLTDPKLVEAGVEKIGRDHATVMVVVPGREEPVTVPMVRQRNQWRVDINRDLKMPVDNPAFVSGIGVIQDAMDAECKRAAADIAGGKYASAKDAYEQALLRVDLKATETILDLSAKNAAAKGR